MERQIGFRVYLISDRKLFSDEDAMYRGIEQALKGGVKAVQLREKDISTRKLLDMAYRLRGLTAGYGALLFINDRVDVAVTVGADGVHLGRTGLPVNAARAVAGERMLIGVSTHSAPEAAEAEKDGADFVTLGPVFDTPSKAAYGRPLGPDAVRRAKAEVSIPIFAIGGVKAEHVKGIMGTGASGVAVISAILASDNIKSTAEEFMRTTK
ncbi:MAG: thiamine phosphate synthase [Nitrospirae bacterium]|nr:thiamine phosphate synthase [Nitrospirota bacterium]